MPGIPEISRNSVDRLMSRLAIFPPSVMPSIQSFAELVAISSFGKSEKLSVPLTPLSTFPPRTRVIGAGMEE